MSEAGSGEDAPAQPGLWRAPAPGKLVGRGHAAGDVLEAYEWDVLESRDGVLRVLAQLPEKLKNPRGQLFGGFTPTYVDFVAVHTFWAGRETRPGHPWLATLNMRVDYFAPIAGPTFEIESRILHRGASTLWVETHFWEAGSSDPVSGGAGGPEGSPPAERARLAYAYTTLKMI